MGAITPSQSVEVNFRFRVGYAMHVDYSMIRCDYTNTTCYKAKALGTAYNISATQGYSTGGQLITVDGNGFADTETIDVKIDGAPCKVISSSLH